MSVMLGTEIQPVDGEEYEIRQYPESDWWYIRDKDYHWISCTSDHRLYDGELFPKQAQDFEPGDIIIHRTGNVQVTESGSSFPPVDSTRVEVRMKRVHLYWANGFLSQAAISK